jgi:hypothetical protein
MKLKMEMLESKCAKKDLEIQNLKQETDEKKNMEVQFKNLEEKFASIIRDNGQLSCFGSLGLPKSTSSQKNYRT